MLRFNNKSTVLLLNNVSIQFLYTKWEQFIAMVSKLFVLKINIF